MNKELQKHYKLPHDTQELNRLDVQHRMWILMAGGLYPLELESYVERLMSITQPRIIDVGCGSGIWAIEMAERFPNAQVVGLDITPLKHKSTPHNFAFKQHNLVDGLPEEYSSQFDIVHCRCVCQHVRDPQNLVDEIVRCAKPGGLVLIPDGRWVGFDEDRKPLQPFVYDASLSIEENIAKVNTKRLSCYAGWLAAFGKASESPSYRLANVMLQKTGKVEDIVIRDYWAPTGWAGKGVPNGAEMGEITRVNMAEFFKTSATTIEGQGVPRQVVDAMRERATEEIDERRHNIWYYTSAVVIGDPRATM